MFGGSKPGDEKYWLQNNTKHATINNQPKTRWDERTTGYWAIQRLYLGPNLNRRRKRETGNQNIDLPRKVYLAIQLSEYNPSVIIKWVAQEWIFSKVPNGTRRYPMVTRPFPASQRLTNGVWHPKT